MPSPPPSVSHRSPRLAPQKPLRHEKPPMVGNYYVHETIGQGSFGKVKRGTHKDTKQTVAIKILNRKKLQSANMDKKIRREIHILSLFRHPNICSLYEVIQTQGDIFLIMEHVNGGELYDYIVRKGKLDEKDARYVYQQIVCAIEYCHHFRVVHRDLKPENILLGPNLQVKLIDFGLSNLMRDGLFLATSCGSPNYAAPEVISGRLYCGPEVDVWSCGVVLYALLCGCLPFDEDTVPMLFKKIKEGKYEVPEHLSFGARALLSGLLAVNPLQRQTIPQIRDNEWFNIDLPPHLAYRESMYYEKDRILPEIVQRTALVLGISESDVINQIKMKDGNGYVSYTILTDVHRQTDITNRTLTPNADNENSNITEGNNNNTAIGGTPVLTACQRELNLGLVLSITPAMEYLLCQSNSTENKPFYNMATYAPCSVLHGCNWSDDSNRGRRGSGFTIARHSKSNSVPCHSYNHSERSVDTGIIRPISSYKHTHTGFCGSSPAATVFSTSAQDNHLIGSVALTNVMYSEAERKATLDANAGWRVGLMSDGGSQAIMEALYSILEYNDIEWKVIAPFHIAARRGRVKPIIASKGGNARDITTTSCGVALGGISTLYSDKTALRTQQCGVLLPENLVLMVYVFRLHDKHDRGFIVDFTVHRGHPILGMELAKVIMESLLDRLN
eukprot:Tbor_TRINITY_DN5991_c5_g2::TRINITY_DN5991_c5_g2_i1::g.19127::m.19127/K07198/PRKAA, AMPK; 5'-AMP-activated protein kinase, catalytic alpha subunit